MKNKLLEIKELKNCPPNARVRVYYVEEEEQRTTIVSKPGHKRLTLKDVIDKMDVGFKQVNLRIDRIETRIDGIDARLDYVVKVNNLKGNK